MCRLVPLLVLASTVLATVHAATDATHLKIDSGEITGLPLGHTGDIRAYKGIPFAASPLGHNRWREPQPVAAWSGPRACHEFQGAPPQPDSAAGAYGRLAGRLDEDCLYLNVFTPARYATEARPVMVWFYGGGFVRGDAAYYDMERLARAGAVVVTVNYRVGIFGFFAHPALSAASPHGVSGNYGLHDMIAGLQWVRRNIAAFGGDPGNVTIFGQSSGASAVCHLMASSRTSGLFHRAISQSSGADNPDARLETMEAAGTRFLDSLGLPNDAAGLAAARALPWREIQAMAEKAGRDSGLRFSVAIDGWLLTEPTSEVFAHGLQQDVPLLIGSNANESDSEYTAGARWFARQHSRKASGVFRYFFSQPGKDPRFQGRGAVHAAEIAYVLGGNARLDEHWNESDRALSAFMTAAWVQFARTGNPHRAGQPEWPRYSPETDPTLELGPEIRTVAAPRAAACDEADRKNAEAVARWHAPVTPPLSP